jgi:hypothetical protein
MFKQRILWATYICLAMLTVPAAAQDTSTSFFITSEGPGDGANLGGLSGADAHCQRLAEAQGIAGKTWKAYLSTSTENARDRIGAGPWHNAKGELIAANIDELHSDANKINKESGLTEKGEPVKGRGDEPNMHDILTGSTPEGTVADGQTCNDWTGNGEGAAMVGHHDRIGLRDDAASKSWNSSHPSRGCGKDAIDANGGLRAVGLSGTPRGFEGREKRQLLSGVNCKGYCSNDAGRRTP